jgi:uncharacterized protein YndB with AHSA1/START domain
MSTVTAVAQRTIEAPADAVYGYLADYRQHHAKFLPPAFSGFEVERGGIGAGTVVRFTVNAGGRSRPYRMEVTEPEPGRVLTETDTGSSLVTVFTVTPQGGDRSLVRIETSWQGAGGARGVFEKLFAPPAMRRIYDDELRRLDGYAHQQGA